MSSPVPPESDLWAPLPADGEEWNDHTIHTHYFGFSIPEEQIGAFIYVRYQPVYKLVSGGVCIFKGMDNLRPLDCEHCNYINTMPYPSTTGELDLIKDNTVKTANGLTIQFLQPGHKARLTYRSPDGKTTFDLTQSAITPLLPRGHVVPGEDVDTDPTQRPGGSEQFMHCVGTLTMGGRTYAVDCYPVRDRSWRQVRTEDEVSFPPVGWSPIAFGPDLSFNQIGTDSSPQRWASIFQVDPNKPVHYFGWVVNKGEVRNVVKVERRVTKYHPDLHSAVEQEIEAQDEKGERHSFKGEAVAVAQLPSWPNNIFIDSVFRWTDKDGRIAYCTYQEAHYHRYQRFCRGRE
ncbi:hypothetical protein BDV18DRAFT_157734 [Aspergillus unguis]